MKRVIRILGAAILFTAAVVFMLYPIISNAMNEKYHSSVWIEYETEVSRTNEDVLREERIAAKIYNTALNPVQFNTESIREAEADYDKLLNMSGSGLMGFLEIPVISVNLPIYHGTGEAVLAQGVGHLVGSSLPIGGAGTHSVLTGHSGVAGKKLFSDLDQMSLGDIFYVHVLNETLAYRVIEIDVVLPHETDLLSIIPDEDLCTLVTCTPFGVNTHRLLVRGRRIPYEKSEAAVEETVEKANTVKSTWEMNYIKGLAIGGGAAIGTILLAVMIGFLRKKWGAAQ